MSMDLDCLDPWIPDKIGARHCERQAVVYVRQSTMRQVEQNRESTRLQYGLADRACRLGWRQEQILVIDDDLGRSATSALDRPGFQRLVAEVGLGHVGLVLGIEVSRLARSCRDWHQLLEMCALFDTLIGDADGSQRTLLVREPFAIDPGAEIVSLVRASAGGAPIVGAPYWTDAAFLAAAGIPTVLYGPGGEGAHAETEWVSVSDTETVVRTLVDVATRLCA